jgi:hypothetical protein
LPGYVLQRPDSGHGLGDLQVVPLVDVSTQDGETASWIFSRAKPLR